MAVRKVSCAPQRLGGWGAEVVLPTLFFRRVCSSSLKGCAGVG
ncbi:hypothetical protein RUMHYD_01577 [Blautia hydrogenotrophica DSM 10507]|uniref:Uncharacterized protein n=1 Tax=Blautia hydrogenotrophica (strain DSM 10507 / JCM 14656 / S5a33) TaxID=476272 RepID=C0CL56_BLAHS|nr:hypothetical protein RUMHYD_01577 [Blautia hydrogenotrophica DSM 10507]